MFEAHVLHILRRYLGEYVRGLSAEALKVSVWQGDVVLKDLQLKAEALNSLKLPIIVKAGFLGSVTLKVPWNRLGKESVVVLLDRIFILAEPIRDERSCEGDDKKQLLEAKRRRLKEAESAILEQKDKKATEPENAAETSSWLGSLIATIVGNLKISITNVHIRYEDSISNPGRPFCSGVTLSRLAAVTIDDNAKETFVSSGALDKLHKSLHLERFTIYHDSNTFPWKAAKDWEVMTPKEWSEVFEAGINEEPAQDFSSTKYLGKHQYLLRPVDGNLHYHRGGKQEKRDPGVAFQNVSLVLNEFSLTVSEAQYCDGLKLLEGVSRYRTRIEFSHFRPRVPVLENPHVWWVYACQAGLQQQKKTWFHLSGERILHLCCLRRKYVQLYADLLQQKIKTESQEIQTIEEELDAEVLLLWRLLAHAKVRGLKSKESNSEKEQSRTGRWWAFGWGTAGVTASGAATEPAIQKQDAEAGHFSPEEWSKLNELLSYRPDEDTSLLPVSEAPDMLQFSVSATITESSVRILGKNNAEILCGNFACLSVGLKLYPKTLECHVKLQSYGLSAPEGSLIKSVSREGKEEALTGDFVHCPLDGNVDWRVSAAISPCYVTVWFASFERFMQFLKSSHAISPDVASETATVLQNKLDKVRRRAQEQLKIALEEQSRFSIDLDLDAPKVRLPADSIVTGGIGTQLLLDLGHFTLHTAYEDQSEEKGNEEAGRAGLYSRFFISGSDIAAYLIDGSFEWSEMQHIMPVEVGYDQQDEAGSIHCDRPGVFPVLDRCGMFLLFEKIRIPHPTYPSHHIAIQVPHLGLHFSPARYQRLMDLFATFKSTSVKEGTEQQESTMINVPWYPADLEGNVRVLFWKGLGNAVAEWQPCWAVLSGSYLYILDSANAQTYQRCCSMNGKQVLDVPSSNIGGSEFVLAVCNRGVELQKGLESSNTVIVQFSDDDCKALWLRSLTAGVYKSSAPVSLSLPEELVGKAEDIPVRQAEFLGQPVLFMTGSLQALQLSIYTVAESDVSRPDCESLIVNLQAGGGKVNLLQQQYDLIIGMKLNYLKIEDKLQGCLVPSCQYIARSVLSKDISQNDDGSLHQSDKLGSRHKEKDFYSDSLSDFGGSQDPGFSHGTSSKYLQSDSMGTPNEVMSCKGKDFSARGLVPLKLSAGTCLMDKIFEESESELKNFVSMHFMSRQFESPDYEGTDVEMSICMATLEFFCNRQTVVALITFGTEISEIVEKQQSSEVSIDKETNVVSSDCLEPSADRVIVNGLLGRGKSRIVFQLKFKVDSVRIFLNKEDGSQLAMLDQERFHMDLNVYPGSFIVSGTLGNLRICDMALGLDHSWGWICDIRDPGCESLVKLEFQSFNVDDDDYQGYDYSLCGRLSSVRIIFLYRFVQEVIAYFSALATPHSQQFTRVVDKVGGIEKLVPQSDIDGAPALKLDVSLETPIIVLPRCSTSKEFMQLDFGYLKVSNSFEWHGGLKDDASAIHLDVLSAEISGINLIVGIDGVEGKAMIQEVRGLHVTVRRPLRDLFRSVPEVQVDVKAEMLRCIISDKEYLVITGCAVTNIAEVPHLPSDFRKSAVTESNSIGASSDIQKVPEIRNLSYGKSSSSRQAASTWTVARVAIEVQNAELELYNGLERESPLARVELQGFWLSYRSTSSEEMDIFVTLPRLCILDLRSETKPEMRLMLGPMADTEDNGASAGQGQSDSEKQPLLKAPFLSMLVMDIRMKQESQAYVIRIQRPRLLVVIDFLLAVGEFFVPSLLAVTGKDESMDVHNDPIVAQEHIRLTSSFHKQEDAVLVLSSNCQLIVDAPDIKEFTYDGGGNILCLDDVDSDQAPYQLMMRPLIVIGPGKRLRFKNIRIKNGFRLKDCLQLYFYSSYSCLEEDGVVLEGPSTDTNMELLPQCNEENSELSINTSMGFSTSSNVSDIRTSFVLDVQAVAPELTFYDSEKWSLASIQGREKLIRAKMDINLMYACKESDKWIRGHVKEFSIEGGSGLTVVDPMVISAEYACVKDKTSLTVFTSDIAVHLSFSAMRLLLCLYNDTMSTFQFGGGHVLSRCSHFDRIWLSETGQRLAIWRPRAPSGYAILSDCITSGEAPPSQAVMAVGKSYRRVKKPVSFELIWSFSGSLSVKSGKSEGTSSVSNECSIWRPVAPPGYVSLGYVSNTGNKLPSLSAVHCVRSDLVTSASINDCIFYVPTGSGAGNGFSIWRIENAAGSFFAHQSTEPPAILEVYDLREVLHQGETNGGSSEDVVSSRSQSAVGRHSQLDRKPSFSTHDSTGGTPMAGRYISTTAHFERMWWGKGNDLHHVIAIWRPVPPPGYAIAGDYITEGLEPPSVSLVLRDDDSGRLAVPIGFAQRMHSFGKGMEDLFVWYPVAPAGYVTLGCVVSRTEETSTLNTVRCVRVDLVSEVNISKRPIWSVSGSKSGPYSCSLWKVENQANTFLARPDLKRPSSRLGYGLIETVKNRLKDTLSAEMKIRSLSITVFDDLRGLMTPLVDVSVTSINVAGNGQTEALNAVCVASMAASTFNPQLEAWEPLVEPFEGIFKYESHALQSDATLKVGKRIRITTANIVNLNVTSANIDALVGGALSWQKQSDYEQKAFIKMELEKDGVVEPSASLISSALEEDDSEKLVIQNKLGSVLFLRTFDHGFEDCTLLECDKIMQVGLPPPNFPDKADTPTGLKMPCQRVAICISEARDLPVNDDGNGQEYFYSLRVASLKRLPEGKDNPIQSARSRCVRPSLLMHGENTTTATATATWNEAFIFDFPQQGSVNVDIRVSNQASKAGRGELIGTLSIPLEAEQGQELTQPSSHWKLVQKYVNQAYQSSWPLVQGRSYPLEFPKQQANNNSGKGTSDVNGSMVVNMYFFTEKSNRNAEREREKNEHGSSDTGLFVGLSPNKHWVSIRSILALGTFPIQIVDNYMGLEVAMDQGQKHAIFRSLVAVSNDTDVFLEVCVCPIALLNSPDESARQASNEPVAVIEEVFENQRYQPLAGWGSKWPGHLLPIDPGRWSTRDYEKSSQVQGDLEAALPPGWIWNTDWIIDKAGYVDDDGWAYGPDFQSLKWPPNSLKSCKKSAFDFIRRRRWVRTRQRIPDSNQDHCRQIITIVQPGRSFPLPLAYTLPQTDYCLQVRPHTESTTAEFLWSRSVSTANQSNRGHIKNGDGQSSSRNLSQHNKNGSVISLFMLNQLEKTEELVICPAARPSASKLNWWLNMEADANILYTEMNSPVYDWRVSIRAPLKLENLLPCNAEYSIWEKQRDANPVQRGRGVVLAGSSVHIFSVDLRNQVYLTWLVQGGWKLEKEIVLISEPSTGELPSGFGLLNQQSGRRLQISLEHDFGATNTAARTVRLFVPYWLCNKAAIPLSYCLVEVEPGKGSDTDSPWLMRAVKAAKQASNRPSHSLQGKTSRLRRVVQLLGPIESIGATPIMLSPQARYNRTGLMPFSPRADDGLLSHRLGISIAASHCNVFQDGISFRDLEDTERVNVNALAANGAYYKLSVFLSMSSERTKVVNFQPHTLFVNRLGQSLCLRQCDLDCAELLYPNDPPKGILWQSAQERELLKVCVHGYKWSTSFSVDSVGMSHILLRSEHDSKQLVIRAEIRNGASESRFLVIFRHVSFASPYRIENHSIALAIQVRQVGGDYESWQLVQPASAVPFAWEDLQRDHQLEIRVDGADPLKSRKYNIDESTDYQPVETEGSPVAALRVTTFKEGLTQVVKICDWMPSNRDLSIVPFGTSGKATPQEQFHVHDTKQALQRHDMENQVHVLVELAEFGLSVVDHTPEELLYLTMQNFSVLYATGLGCGTSRFKVRVDGLQLDNQLSLTPMPVLIRPQVSDNPLDFLLKCTVTSRDYGSADRYAYPYIGIQGPSTPNTAFLTSIHEPIIWHLYEMFQRLNLGRLTASQTTDVAIDPVIHIGLLNTSEIRFKVSLAMSPTQRPGGALGFWASLMTALGNTDDMQVRIAPHVHEDISMRQSALTSAFLSSVRKDLLSHPLLLLSGVDILGNASSALGHMSKGVAALSMDQKFIRSRKKQDTKAGVEGFGDGVREGVGALGKGLFRGVTGILTKPFEGAKSSGMEGFVQGVGKGIIGVAAQPVSGVLDLLSKTTEGANAMRMKIAAAITSEAALLRRRLPRVIGGDNILRPYDEYKAQGQTLLQLAERSSIFGPMDIFKIRGKFALSDAYEDHYNLPKGRTLIVTHRRVLLLQHPTNIIVQKKPDLLKDPCTVLWDVTWKDIARIDLVRGKHDSKNAKPSRLALYLQSGSQDARIFDSKDLIRIVKCHPDSDQPAQIRISIQQAMATYATDQSKSGGVQRKRAKNVRRPYSGPVVDTMSMGFFQGPATPVSMPPIATFSSLVENTSLV